jgi:hypothetical protein
MILNDYSTHLPTLQYVLDKIGKCDNIFEYGMGMYSTTLFSKKAEKLIAVEMQNEKWFSEMSKQNFKDNVNLHCMIGKDPAIEYFKSLELKFDVVLVDGHFESRWKCINEAFGKCDIIIAHDTENVSYDWNLVNLPEKYLWLDIKIHNPWTSVITNNKDLTSSLCKDLFAKVR